MQRGEGAWKTQKQLSREPGSTSACCCCHGYSDVTRKKKCHLQIQLSHPEKLSCSGRAEQRACELGVHRGGLGEAGRPLCAPTPRGLELVIARSPLLLHRMACAPRGVLSGVGGKGSPHAGDGSVGGQQGLSPGC